MSDASVQSDSYRFLMEMNQNTQVVNLTTGGSQKLYTHTFSVGSMNMSTRALKMIMATLTVPKGDEENATASSMEEFLINDTIYFKMDGNWTSMVLPGVSAAWSRQNTMGQQIDMLNRSNLSLLGSEAVEGQECYKLLARMNGTVIRDQISEETGSFLPEQFLNISELFSNMTLEAYYWIAKDTHQLKKTEVMESFVLNPQSLGLPTNETEKMEMRVNTTISLTFEGINESVNVVLPAEASKAQPFFQSLMSSNKTTFDLAGDFINTTEINATATDTNTTLVAK